MLLPKIISSTFASSLVQTVNNISVVYFNCDQSNNNFYQNCNLRGNCHHLTWLGLNPVDLLLELTLHPFIVSSTNNPLNDNLHLFLQKTKPLLDCIFSCHRSLEKYYFLLSDNIPQIRLVSDVLFSSIMQSFTNA